MPRIPEPNEDRLARLERIVDELQKGSPLDSTSVSQGTTQWIGGELRGEQGAHFSWSGNADIDGAVTISLTLNVSGSTVIGGTVDIGGTVKIDGTVDIGGAVEIRDNLTVSAATLLQGLTRVLNDLRVEGGGSIIIDGPIPFTLKNGAVIFSNGTEIVGDGGRITMRAAGASIIVGPSVSQLTAGGNSVSLTDERTIVTGPLRLMDAVQVVEEILFQGPITAQDAVTLENARLNLSGLPYKTGTGLPAGALWADVNDENRIYVALS